MPNCPAPNSPDTLLPPNILVCPPNILEASGQWALIFCVDVHMADPLPIHMRPPEPDPLM